MSCGRAIERKHVPLPQGWFNVAGQEGFRLFFPLCALYAAVWPAMWVLAFGFDLPLARSVPPSLWHAHEMLVGAFGAALIGFLTTAAPEWTDTEPPRGTILWLLAGLWLFGRAVGFFGWDGFGMFGAVADLGWMSFLLMFLLRLSWQRRTDVLLAFAFWLAVLLTATATARLGFASGNMQIAEHALLMAGFAYLGLLGLALARITVPVTNLVLDPSERTSPFRPHPGRLHLAPGLTFVAMAGELVGVSAAVSGFLLIAAGACFVDRVAEAFIGREALRAEILMLSGASALAGLGLILTGASRLGAPWDEVAGLHVAFMGGLGLGIYVVFSIAGLLHTNRPLGLPLPVRLGAAVLVVSVAFRLAPDMGFVLPGPLYGLAVISWSAAFVIWLAVYWPIVGRFEQKS